MNEILFLVGAHIVGDFYLQTEDVTDDEEVFDWSRLKRSLIYCLTFLLAFIVMKANWNFLLVIGISHVLIDICCVQLTRRKQEKKLFVFLIRQLALVIVIWIGYINVHFDFGLNKNYLAFGLPMLMVIKPTSILISLTLKSIFNVNEESNIKIGRYIGYLERIIILILCLYDAIPAIGFIIAAKTLVRYQDISKNTDHFQEKYLIGTLLSTIGALICFGIFKII